MTQSIIIDTDPGQDDAVALLLALASPELAVLGITVVAGNIPLHHTLRNARILRELSGHTAVPIFAGADRPMQRELVTAEDVHGETGLEGPVFDEPILPAEPVHAVDFLIDTLRARPAGSVTLCTLGPLTNVALALQRAPDIAARIARIVVMGGARSEGGNVTPAAEFNIHVDPHAADLVLRCGAPIVMLPLDVTHRARTSPARIAAIEAAGGRCSRSVAQILRHYGRFHPERYGEHGTPLHDPCVIAWLLQPQLFTGREVHVAVETASELTLGMTVVDWWSVTGRAPNALYLTEVDADGFYSLLTERLARLP
jgi:purine nucleosidase